MKTSNLVEYDLDSYGSKFEVKGETSRSVGTKM